MALTPKQRSFLRGKAHHLNPVVMLGKEGVSEAIIKATDKALEDHELIKIKVPAEDQDEFHATVEELMAQTKAEIVQKIGHLLVIYRKAQEPGRISEELKRIIPIK
jgi:RNA-binding protein